MLSRYRITILKEVRSILKLKTGDKVIFEIKEGVITMLLGRGNPLAECDGAFSAFKGVEEINVWISEMREEEV